MRGSGTRARPHLPLANDVLAERLEEIADLLEKQAANELRVRAHRRAAETVRAMGQPAHEVLSEQGIGGLTGLPGISPAIARTLEQLARTDHLPLLERLRGSTGGADVLTSVPGIGPELARRIHGELGVESLYELEAAAHDGRLDRVLGMGAQRVRAVRECLAARFRRGVGGRSAGAPLSPGRDPPVDEILDIDREYRQQAQAGALPRIAPRRFNPTGEAWLPILHTTRGVRHYTALWSNTAQAHERGTTHDWVVIYRDDPQGDGQWTVVTAREGTLRGQRIVRGREEECRAVGCAGPSAEEGP